MQQTVSSRHGAAIGHVACLPSSPGTAAAPCAAVRGAGEPCVPSLRRQVVSVWAFPARRGVFRRGHRADRLASVGGIERDDPTLASPAQRGMGESTTGEAGVPTAATGEEREVKVAATASSSSVMTTVDKAPAAPATDAEPPSRRPSDKAPRGGRAPLPPLRPEDVPATRVKRYPRPSLEAVKQKEAALRAEMERVRARVEAASGTGRRVREIRAKYDAELRAAKTAFDECVGQVRTYIDAKRALQEQIRSLSGGNAVVNTAGASSS
eukprot:ctg_4681.g742